MYLDDIAGAQHWLNTLEETMMRKLHVTIISSWWPVILILQMRKMRHTQRTDLWSYQGCHCGARKFGLDLITVHQYNKGSERTWSIGEALGCFPKNSLFLNLLQKASMKGLLWWCLDFVVDYTRENCSGVLLFLVEHLEQCGPADKHLVVPALSAWNPRA